ncbi:hypothetical protein J6590_076710 [Homalodisca vitripennis]|nr:hypothetical protein J6590_076710 [Homalodisca vitripennis]
MLSRQRRGAAVGRRTVAQDYITAGAASAGTGPESEQANISAGHILYFTHVDLLISLPHQCKNSERTILHHRITKIDSAN